MQDLGLGNYWSHIGIVYHTRKNVQFYLNGTLLPGGERHDLEIDGEISFAIPPQQQPPKGKLVHAIGNTTVYGRIAVVDELTFWNRKLTPDEMSALYSMGVASKVSNDPLMTSI